jgi:hypothetical protein
MTENQAENTTLETDVDVVLQLLVSIVNQTSIGIGVTLNVGGLTISGELVSKKSYFEGLAQEMASAGGNDEIKAGFQEFFKRLRDPPESSGEETSKEN